MSNINVSIPLPLELISKLDELAKNENKEFNDFIVKELEKVVNEKVGVTKVTKKSNINVTEIIEKYRNM